MNKLSIIIPIFNEKTDKQAIIFAKNVEKQSKIYKNQLIECQKSLDRKKYIIF